MRTCVATSWRRPELDGNSGCPSAKEMSKRYPADWNVRRRFIIQYRVQNKCEWCGAANDEPHPVTGGRVLLTLAHVWDKRPEMASLLNLAALCQRCHNRWDAAIGPSAERANASPSSCEMVRCRCPGHYTFPTLWRCTSYFFRLTKSSCLSRIKANMLSRLGSTNGLATIQEQCKREVINSLID